MTKKLTAVLLGCAIATSVFLPVAGCIGGGGNGNSGNRETNVNVTSKGAQVCWNKVEGAKSYEIFYSPSRFGAYEHVKTQTSCKYTGKDKYGYYRVAALDGGGEEISSELYSYEIEIFGNNTHVYDAQTDDQELIQADIDAAKEATGQFSEKRFAGLFKQGEYNDLDLQMRYYMTFAGLGDLPTDVVIGKFNTYGQLANGNATCNFWWGAENFTVDDTVQWAVSQATSFRRMKVNGDLYLYDTGYSKGNYASGGFISDSVITGTVNTGTQQQWFTRNSTYGKWNGCNINMVFSGCEGGFADGNYSWEKNRNITRLTATTVMSEKPYLTFDGGYYVSVPRLQNNYKGNSWSESQDYEDKNDYISIDKFYVARSDRDNAKTINAALKKGKHILFTPGIYAVDEPLLVEKEDTVIMGIGLASLRLTEKNTETIMRVSDVDGIRISGILFDAGPSSETLLELGKEKTGVSHKDNPTVLNDVYFRIGGAYSGATFVDKTLVINSDNVVGDNFWVWRADHGNAGTVGWDINRAINGVIVNGDSVTIYGLMVEHFQQYQTVWNGENGYMVFYQSETPYDPPEQEDWTSEWKGIPYEGYASYKVADEVTNHTAYGLGVYYVASSRLHNVFNLDHAVELPSNSGIRVEHMAIANFLSYGDKQTVGGIRYIVNGYGKSNFDGSQQRWQSFIAGIATP